MDEKIMEKGRSGVLDLFKIIATIFILFHHYQQVFGIEFDKVNFCSGTHFYFGYMVELFFVISGLLSARYVRSIAQGEPFDKFFKKKYFRFFPMVFLSALVDSILLIRFYFTYGGWCNSIPIDFATFFLSATGAQVIMGDADMGINNPLWYISALLVCYVVLYFCVWVAKHIRVHEKYLFVGIVVLGCVMLEMGLNYSIVCTHVARGFIAFFSGLLWEKKIANENEKKQKWVIFVALGSTMIMLITPKSGAANLGLLAIFLGTMYFPALIYTFKTKRLEKLLSNKVVERMASISFEVYVWHSVFYLAFFMILYDLHLRVSLNTYGVMLIMAAVIYLLSAGMYYCVEKPIHKKIFKDGEK